MLIFIITGCQPASNEQATQQEEEKPQKQSAIMLLPDWEQAPRERILKWIEAVTTEGSEGFIPVEDRIAVFDNDGTLWPEQPYPNQLQYCIDFIKARWEEHPEWDKDPVIKGIYEGNFEPLKEAGMQGLTDILSATHNGQTESEFAGNVATWADTAKNERFNQLYVDVVYAPMLQLLTALRKYEFKTFIVSGGGADFMRVFAEDVYGIPPYQVIGSYGEVKYEVVDGEPVVTKVPGNIYVDDKAGKPQAIHRFIGKVPVFCGGNSDGDQAMMQYTSGSKYNTMCVILHHTDAEREYAYDTKTLSGHLETALEEAKEKNWLVVDMKEDFKKIFAFEK